MNYKTTNKKYFNFDIINKKYTDDEKNLIKTTLKILIFLVIIGYFFSSILFYFSLIGLILYILGFFNNEKNVPEELKDLFYNSVKFEIKTDQDHNKYVIFYSDKDNSKTKIIEIKISENINISLKTTVKEIITYFSNILKNNYNFQFKCGIKVTKNTIIINGVDYYIEDLYKFILSFLEEGETITYDNTIIFKQFKTIYYITKNNNIIINEINRSLDYENSDWFTIKKIILNNPIKNIIINKNDKYDFTLNDDIILYNFRFNGNIEELKNFLNYK